MKALIVIACLASSAAMAASPPGASSCSGCHAATATPAAAIPGIYRRDAGETLATMIAFRDGARPATVMNRIAKGFSDDELRAIAAWLATQK